MLPQTAVAIVTVTINAPGFHSAPHSAARLVQVRAVGKPTRSQKRAELWKAGVKLAFGQFAQSQRADACGIRQIAARWPAQRNQARAGGGMAALVVEGADGVDL